MRLGAHLIATMAVAIFLAPTLFADDTPGSASTSKMDESLSSAADPGARAPKPAGKTPLPYSSRSSKQTPAGRATRKISKSPGAGSGGNATPKVELFAGYSYWRAMPQSTGNRIESMPGGSASLAFNLNNHVGLVLDFGGIGVDTLKFNNGGAAFNPSGVVDVEASALTVLFGPRVSFRKRDRLTPFVQVLGGIVRADQVGVTGCTANTYPCAPLSNEIAFAMTAGGGADYRLNHRFALRLVQAEYLLTRFLDPRSTNVNIKRIQNNMRLSAGIVLRFGGEAPPLPPPNRFPVASCSIDTKMVYAGSGDVAGVHVMASDPDNDPLTYTWVADGGAVDGNGSEGRWTSAGAAPGTYKVRVRVDDGRGGTADCSSDIRVELRPNRPPSMSCSADRNSVMAGEPVQILATASDPDNHPLTYAWKSSGGRLRNSEPSSRFDTSGLAPAIYQIMGHVDDSHGGTADCTLAINVRQPPPPPEMVELEHKLALHSIYFQTARPTIPNPNGGLVVSQEQILETLARDFKRYLTFKPEAHLVLAGHADQRGSKEYNKALTDRRVDRAKSYLIEHGVPAGVLDTTSFGDEDNLNADQVKEQIADNPDLTPNDRKQMLNDLPVMVLANNRRVDIGLTTTGQQSTHRYPFNAQDYLALINTKGVGDKSPTKVARKKREAKPAVTNSNATGRR
jgi:outer membrane protein OmpA-like peptidoglycan-associated protein